MKPRTLILSVVGLSFSTVLIWATVKVFIFACVLPLGVMTESDGLANAISAATNDSYHRLLKEGDPDSQCAIVSAFISAANNDPSSGQRILAEYEHDLRELLVSNDPPVAALTQELLGLIVGERAVE